MNALSNRPARAAAVSRQDEQIQQNVAKIEEQRRRPSALALMASRLGVSESNLSGTLKATVFKNCSDAEFVALVIVANEYGLNPLTKEMYAFPQKGGGIVPLVSIDGWIRIMNGHPQFDGIDFTDIPDGDGKLLAIEAVIYRKDRSRPIRVTEYLDECKRNTEPWNKSPARMLRHRALIQCARYAFGFSGIYTDDDAEVQMMGDPVEARNVTPPPSRQQTASPAITHDPRTGEIIDDEESARALDAQTQGWQEGPADSQRGERFNGLTLEQAMEEIDVCQTVIDVNARVEELAQQLSQEDGDELFVHAGVRKTELGAK
ncbi:RecT family recombinase [Sphingobium sp. LMC3-1-1.1]|uniref:RecT family recombinase n=1 Tax=Sphingobium sp. LMC3-1-1.1 TaxID=3135241 RepID=UPI0039C95AB1